MLWNTILLAVREIRRNVMRSFLTILGIVIGVAAVIIMVTIGGGATAQVQQQIASLGTNVLMISPGRHMGPGQSTAQTPFKIADVEAIAGQIEDVVAATSTANQSMMAIYGNENWTTTATGTDNHYFTVTKRSVAEGRTFSESELRAGATVCIVGETIRKKLFGGQSPLGEKIRLEKLSCEVIGLLDAKGQSSMGTDQDDLVIIPLRTLQRRITGNQNIGLIRVAVRDGVDTDKVKDGIELLLRERRHIPNGKEDDFHVMDPKEIAAMMTGTTKTLTALLSAVAAVSLLVGGIGIMNIMLVSVTERTREIGIRLAIGALEGEVLLQFLVESVVLSSFGGIVGIVLAVAASFWIAEMLRVPFVFNAGVCVLAFLFSAAIGVIFGYFPALKAARLDPIDALRHE